MTEDITMKDAIGRLRFAWTPADRDGWQYSPPYVNLTGRKLTVRGLEIEGVGGPRQGPTVTVDLPDEALSELLRTLLAALDGDEVSEAMIKAGRRAVEMDHKKGYINDEDLAAIYLAMRRVEG